MPLLEIDDLTVEFMTGHGSFRAVDGVSLSVDAGDVLAIVGESGSGKSVAMLAVMGLLPWTANVTRRPPRLRRRRPPRPHAAPAPPDRRQGHGDDLPGADVEPQSVLHGRLPDHRGAEGASRPEPRGAAAAGDRICSSAVGISDVERRLRSFPHQLSGGMNQRVMIAMALACRPRLLIADEPTTALDVTIQAQILDLLLRLQQETGMALILITHDMGVVAETAERVAVLYAGQKVEEQRGPSAVRRSASSLHGGAARFAARARHRPALAFDRRRRARPLRPADGLPLLAALRPCDQRCCRTEAAAAAGARSRRGPLPLSAARRPTGRPSRHGERGGRALSVDGNHVGARGARPHADLLPAARVRFVIARDSRGRRRQLHARRRQDARRRRRSPAAASRRSPAWSR